MLRNGPGDDSSTNMRPQGGDANGTPGAADQDMCSLVQDEIIPRLLAAHRHDESELRPRLDAAGSLAARLDPDSVADRAIECDAGGMVQMFEAAIARGADLESILVDVLAPAARCLGARWEQDSADFIDVTMGLWRLQEVVHELTGRTSGAAASRHESHSILCAVAPGDDHSFGSVILEEFFRRAGWNASSCRAATRSELLSTLLADWYDVVALTVTVEQPSATLANLVAALRAASRNPDVLIMVGGRIFSEQPGLADAVGADATAIDARGALLKAERLVGKLEVGDRYARVPGAPPGQPPLRRGVVPG